MNGTASTILLVDDDLDICANMADIFSDLGYSVDIAHEGRSALEMLRRRPYDVALLDLKMPGMDGVALSREIRRVRSGTISLLITAYAGDDSTREAIDAGVWRVLPKPADLPRLLGLVEEALMRPLVLVVDDDVDLCDNLLDLLRDRGYRVCLAHDEEEAIGRFRETTRVVLLDLRLPGPGGDGVAVFRHIRELNQEARVVLITGSLPEPGSPADRLIGEGVDAVHLKPLDMPRLLADLERLAGGECERSA